MHPLRHERLQSYRQEERNAWLGFAVMAIYITAGNWLALRLVAVPMAACRLAAIWQLRRHRALLDGLTDDEAFRKSEIAFIRASYYWYTLPLALGLVGVAAAVWWHGGAPAIYGLVAVAGIVMPMGVRRMHNQLIARLRLAHRG
jgi:hypothetical protein